MSAKQGKFPVVSAFNLGEIAGGEITVGEIAVGEIAVGEITVGELTLLTRPSLSASLSGSGASACP